MPPSEFTDAGPTVTVRKAAAPTTGLPVTRHYKEPIICGNQLSFTPGLPYLGQATCWKPSTIFSTIYEHGDYRRSLHLLVGKPSGTTLTQIVEKPMPTGKIPEGKHVIYCNTPSYIGSHVTGYSNMVSGIVKCLAKSTEVKNDKINLISGWGEPSDMREVKRIATLMGAAFTLFPDTSDVVDAPQTGTFELLPKGGTKILGLDRLRRQQSDFGFWRMGHGRCSHQIKHQMQSAV